MDQVLEIAALTCAAVGFVLLLVRFFGRQTAQSFQAWRFRRSLRRLDAMADRWAMELPPRHSSPDEVARRRQRRREGDS